MQRRHRDSEPNALAHSPQKSDKPTNHLGSLPVELVLCIGETLLQGSYALDRSSITALARLVRASSFFYAVLNPLLYQHDICMNAYSLYWACFNGNVGTARHAVAAGARPNHKWVAAGNRNALGLMILAERPGGRYAQAGSLEKFVKARHAYGVYTSSTGRLYDKELRDWNLYAFKHQGFKREGCSSINYNAEWTTGTAGPNRLLGPRQICLPESRMGRMAYARANAELDRKKVSDPEDRAMFRDVILKESWEKEIRFDVLSALHLAASHGHAGVAEVLLDSGTDVDLISGSTCGCGRHQKNSKVWMQSAVPALHVAILHKHDSVIDLLVARGAQLYLSRNSPALQTMWLSEVDFCEPGVGREASGDVKLVWSALEDCVHAWPVSKDGARDKNQALALASRITNGCCCPPNDRKALFETLTSMHTLYHC